MEQGANGLFCGDVDRFTENKDDKPARNSLGTPNAVEVKSRYRRIQRFVHSYALSVDQVAWFIMTLFGFINNDYYLTLDRTNWKWGKKH